MNNKLYAIENTANPQNTGKPCICMDYWPNVRSRWLDMSQVFFCVFMDRDEVEVHTLAKNERGQYPAILTEKTWSIKDSWPT